MKTLLLVIVRVLLFLVLLGVLLVIGGSSFGPVEVLLATLLAAAVCFGPALVAHWRPKAS